MFNTDVFYILFQYFATVNEISDLTSSSIPWLNASIFSGVGTKKESDAFNNVAAFMKSSDCIGSIVNVVTNGVTTELQRVVSPCQCEFYYVSLDPELDPFAEDFEATQYTVWSNDSILVFIRSA